MAEILLCIVIFGVLLWAMGCKLAERVRARAPDSPWRDTFEGRRPEKETGSKNRIREEIASPSSLRSWPVGSRT